MSVKNPFRNDSYFSNIKIHAEQFYMAITMYNLELRMTMQNKDFYSVMK